MNTSFARALICAFTIAGAVFLLEAVRAQGIFRTEVYPLQTVTLGAAHTEARNRPAVSRRPRAWLGRHHL